MLPASPGSWLERQTLMPHPDLQDQNLHSNRPPGVHVCLKLWEALGWRAYLKLRMHRESRFQVDCREKLRRGADGGLLGEELAPIPSHALLLPLNKKPTHYDGLPPSHTPVETFRQLIPPALQLRGSYGPSSGLSQTARQRSQEGVIRLWVNERLNLNPSRPSHSLPLHTCTNTH